MKQLIFIILLLNGLTLLSQEYLGSSTEEITGFFKSEFGDSAMLKSKPLLVNEGDPITFKINEANFVATYTVKDDQCNSVVVKYLKSENMPEDSTYFMGSDRDKWVRISDNKFISNELVYDYLIWSKNPTVWAKCMEVSLFPGEDTCAVVRFSELELAYNDWNAIIEKRFEFNPGFAQYLGNDFQEIFDTTVTNELGYKMYEKDTLFIDSFDNNDNIWYHDQGEVGNGYLLFSTWSKHNFEISTIPIKLDESKNYEIEAELKILNGDEDYAGMVWNYGNDEGHFLAFNGLHQSFVFDEESNSENCYPENLGVMLPYSSINKVSIRKIGKEYLIYFNEILSYIIPYVTPNYFDADRNQIGFFVNHNTELKVYELRVSYLINTSNK